MGDFGARSDQLSHCSQRPESLFFGMHLNQKEENTCPAHFLRPQRFQSKFLMFFFFPSAFFSKDKQPHSISSKECKFLEEVSGVPSTA